MNYKNINNCKPYRAYNLLAKNLDNIDISDEFGFIKVRVITELGKLPLKDASVTVYASLNELVEIETVKTDEMGNTPIIKLPVSYNPKDVKMDIEYYYTDYNIRVLLENYYPIVIYDIQVFPDITTEFDINLTRIPVNAPYPRRERTTTIPRINL